MADYLYLFLVVLAVNLMPAFGPPTWAVLVFASFRSDLAPVPMVMTGAVAAASGRLLLALAFRRFGAMLSERSRANLASAKAALEAKKRNLVAALGLFALSPVPSAQLFEAAGMAGVRLVPFTLAFFAGRIVSYSLYVGAAETVKDTSIGDLVTQALGDPVMIVVQLVLIGLLVALTRIDWSRVARR